MGSSPTPEILWTVKLERIILTLVGERSKAMSAEGSDDIRGISKNVPHSITMSPAYHREMCGRESHGTVFMGIEDSIPSEGGITFS
jgi:hypothetical protein